MHKYRMLQSRRFIYGLLLMVMIFSLTGCQEELFEPGDTAIVTFDRQPGAELIGFFTASEWGIYDEYALNMEYTINLVTQQTVYNVVNGIADFGIASSLDIAAARARGDDVVAVATIYRYNPAVLVTIGDRLVKRPRDLRGKRIAVDTPDLSTLSDQQFVRMIENIGLNLDEMDLIAGANSVRDNLLLGDQVDVATGFSATRDVLLLRNQGYDARAHFLSDYGVLVYPMVIFTTGERIEQDPDYVQRFVEATLLGYEEALMDPSGALLALPQSGVNPALEAMVMNAQIPYIDPVDAPVGWMNLSVWERSLDLLPPELTEGLSVFSCYTNQFVESKWLQADGE